MDRKAARPIHQHETAHSLKWGDHVGDGSRWAGFGLGRRESSHSEYYILIISDFIHDIDVSIAQFVCAALKFGALD